MTAPVPGKDPKTIQLDYSNTTPLTQHDGDTDVPCEKFHKGKSTKKQLLD